MPDYGHNSSSISKCRLLRSIRAGRSSSLPHNKLISAKNDASCRIADYILDVEYGSYKNSEECVVAKTKNFNYIKELMIPFILTWIGYQSSSVGDLVETMQAEPTYLDTCMWLLALLVFGYAIAQLVKTFIIKFLYDIEGEKKQQMYKELEVIRAERHKENVEISGEAQAPAAE